MHLFFHNHRFIYREPTRIEAERGGALAFVSDPDALEDKKKKQEEPKKPIESGEQAPSPEKEKKTPEEDVTKDLLDKLKKRVSKSPFENPEEHKQIREAIENLTPQQLKEYYDNHRPETYNGRMWSKWNMDFVKNVMTVTNATALTARKYAWAFQEWLRDKKFNPGGVDGRIGKKTVEGLARYLCANGYPELCSAGEGKEIAKKVRENIPELSEENESKYFDAYKIALKAGYPNLDLGRGYIIDRPTFTAIFKDVVSAQVSFDPFNIRGWEQQFRGLEPFVSRDELLKIYPYYPIGPIAEDKSKKPPLVARQEPINMERERVPKEELSDADLEQLPNIAYKTKIGPETDGIKKAIDKNYEWIYGRNLANIKAGNEIDAGAWLTEDYLETAPRPIWQAYRTYLEKVEELKEKKHENKKISSRATATPTQKKEVNEAFENTKEAKENAMANLERAIDKDRENKKKEIDKWLKKNDLPASASLEYIELPSPVLEKKIPVAPNRIFSVFKNSGRTKIFNTFKDLVRNCDLNKLGELDDIIRNSPATAELGPEGILNLFNRAILERNEDKFIQFKKTLTRRS